MRFKGKRKTRANPKLTEKDQSPNLHVQINDIKSGRILKYLTNSLLWFFFSFLGVTCCVRNCFIVLLLFLEVHLIIIIVFKKKKMISFK